jgi:hypothetical protein
VFFLQLGGQIKFRIGGCDVISSSPCDDRFLSDKQTTRGQASSISG